jgi:hypothetical protein
MRHSLDEADIASSVPVNHVPSADLLGLQTAPVDMPRSGRFDEISSPNDDGARSPDDRRSMNGPDKNPFGPQTGPRSLNVYEPARHGPYQQRRYSFASAAAARRNSNTIAQQLYGNSHDLYDSEDVDGDLGYAAAEGQMGNRRKVIVERLEAVKSRNPVFTWC